MFFLHALSTGIALIEDTENVGTGIRIDYGYSDANKFRVVTAWSECSCKTIRCIKRSKEIKGFH
jgi:hypothetical protein